MPANGFERACRLVIRLAVVDDDRKAELGGELEVRVEESPLLVERRVLRTVSRPVSPTATAFGCARSSRSSAVLVASAVPA